MKVIKMYSNPDRLKEMLTKGRKFKHIIFDNSDSKKCVVLHNKPVTKQWVEVYISISDKKEVAR